MFIRASASGSMIVNIGVSYVPLVMISMFEFTYAVVPLQASLQVSLQSMHGKQDNRATSSVDADAQMLIQNLRADVKSCKDRIAKLRKSKETLQAEYEEEIQQLQEALELAKSATQWKSDMKMAMMQFDDVPAVVADKQLVETDESNQSLTQDLISFSETAEPKIQNSKAVTSRDKPKTAAAQSIESVERYLMKVGVESRHLRFCSPLTSFNCSRRESNATKREDKLSLLTISYRIVLSQVLSRIPAPSPRVQSPRAVAYRLAKRQGAERTKQGRNSHPSRENICVLGSRKQR